MTRSEPTTVKSVLKDLALDNYSGGCRSVTAAGLSHGMRSAGNLLAFQASQGQLRDPLRNNAWTGWRVMSVPS